MFGWIKDFFTGIWQVVNSILTFLINGIMSIFKLILMLPEYMTYLANMISILPVWIIAFLVGIVAITVIWTVRKAI